MSGGAASSSGQGLKRTAGHAKLPEDADVSYPQGTKRGVLESAGSGMESSRLWEEPPRNRCEHVMIR